MSTSETKTIGRRVRTPRVDSAAKKNLEEELTVTREHLRLTIEDLETSKQELKTSNEEVETSREELQSLNEKLNTVNNQLSDKVDELQALSNDMINLLHSSRIVTVFLDHELRLKHFTPASARLFNFKPSDEGRPISDISRNFSDEQLLDDARRAMAAQVEMEAEVAGADERFYLRRVLPYRTTDQRSNGVVITMVDITQFKHQEDALRQVNATLEQQLQARTEALRQSEYFAQCILNTAGEAIISIDANGLIETFNTGAEQMFGYRCEEVIGANVSVLMPEPHAARHPGYLRRYAETGERRIFGQVRVLEAIRRDGTLFPIELSVGEIDHELRFTGIIRDITAQRALQREVAEIADLEQRRIGQELHDGSQQELIGLGLLATSLANRLDADAHAEGALAHRIAEGIALALENIHVSVADLIAAKVDSAGLSAALNTLAARVRREHEIDCRFSCVAELNTASPKWASQLYRIAQEAVTNAIKHSGTRSIAITLSRQDSVLTLEIRDAGCGIAQDTERGLGLNIMKYRAELIGGNLGIAPGASGGTVVSCVCTLSEVP